MKIWAISDLQRDLNRQGGLFIPDEQIDADVCVIAGDFHPPLQMSIIALSKISFRMPVVYVAGNRDFYGQTMEESLEFAKVAARSPQGKGIHILNDESVVIGDTRFIGSTLWTDMALDGPVTDETYNFARKRITDFMAIAEWTPERQIAAHKKSRAFIEAELATSFDGPTVVVSHHTPHPSQP